MKNENINLNEKYSSKDRTFDNVVYDGYTSLPYYWDALYPEKKQMYDLINEILEKILGDLNETTEAT